MWGICRGRPRKVGVSTQSEQRTGSLAARSALAIAGSLALAAAALASPPAFDLYSASPPAVRPGETVAFAVDAHDPDCGPLPTSCTSGCGQIVRSDLTRWTISGGSVVTTANGTPGSPYHAEMTWRAPTTAGTYTITISLSDNGGTFGCSGSTRQTDTRTLALQVSDPPNMPPQLQALSAQSSVIFPGESTALTCEATDPEGGAITYSWSTDLGVVTPAAGGAAQFSGATPGLATVTCRANDPNGGQASGLLRLSISGAASERRVRGSLATPHRVAIGRLGELLAVDRGSGVVRFFHLGNGAPSHSFAQPLATAIASDWQGRVIVGLGDGKALALDRSGNLIQSLPDPGDLGEVSDIAVDPVRQRVAVLHRPTGRVVIYDASLELHSAFGSTGDSPATFLSPAGVDFMPDGRIVVADSGHGQIKLFDSTGATLLLTFGGTGSALGKFTALDDVAVDGDGLVYASDPYQSRVQVFNPDGTVREALGTWGDQLGRFKTPSGLAVAFDRLVVASTNTPSLEVFRLDAAAPTVPLPRVESISATPTALTFGEQPVDSASAPQLVQLANGSSTPLGIVGVRAEGDFAVAPRCPAALEPGASCTFEVTFSPSLPGARSGRLALETSDGVIRTVSLAGTGSVGADSLLSPAAVDFGNQPIGRLGQARRVLLINPGTAPLALAGIQVTGEFALAHSCPAVLPARGSCELTVQFAPGGPGTTTGRILVASSSPHSPVVATLTGRGVGPALAIDPPAFDFGLTRVGEASSMRFFDLSNRGDETVVVAPLAASEEAADRFLLVEDRCSSATLEPGGSCRFAVVFQPATPGRAFGSLAARTLNGAAVASTAFEGEGEGTILIEIPTLSEWGLALFALLVAAAGAVALRGRTAG